MIFDMDGVIVDSEPLHYEVNKEIFSELDIEVSKSEYNSYIGTSNQEMWELITERHNLEESPKKLTKLQQEKNLEHVNNGEVMAVDNVVKVINEIADSELKLALGSSSPEKLIYAVISFLNIKDLFQVIESGENVSNGKPAPDLFLKIARDLDITSDNILVIEDSHNGVKAAKKAGMNCIAYKNENSGNQDLSPADLIIDDFNELSIKQLKEFK
ncbi:MAG: HAD family hydrolase [Bacillota bacterium]